MPAPRRVVAIVALATLAAAPGCGKETGSKGSATTLTTVTAPATTVTSSATATTVAPQGTVLTAAGAFLVAAPQPTVQSSEPPTAPCATLVDAGWTNDTCGAADMAGGPRVWLVEKKASSPSPLWRARVVHWSQGKGAWLVDLAFSNEGAAPGKQPDVDLIAIKVKAADLTGDGKAEVVFGYHSSGTGGYLAYDIVVDSPSTGPSVAAARGGMSKGQASVAGGTITDYAAAFPGNTPGCCPAYFEKAVVQYSAGAFRLTPAGQVPAPGPGQLDL